MTLLSWSRYARLMIFMTSFGYGFIITYSFLKMKIFVDLGNGNEVLFLKMGIFGSLGSENGVLIRILYHNKFSALKSKVKKIKC